MLSSDNSTFIGKIFEFSLPKETSLNFLSFADYIFNNSIDFQKEYLVLWDQIKAGKSLTKEIPTLKDLKEHFTSFLHQRFVNYS